MTPPESPDEEPRWGERRRPRADDAAAGRRPGADDAAAGGQRPRTAEEELADFYADLGGGSRAGGDPPPPPRSGPDFSALFVLLDLLRRAAPSDLQDRIAALIREALLTLRSLIDWYLDRLDHPAREPKVEDIPIE